MQALAVLAVFVFGFMAGFAIGRWPAEPAGPDDENRPT